MLALNEVDVQMEHTIEIKKIVPGGYGLGYIDDGMVVLTHHVLPGEQIRVKEVKRFSGHILAKTLNIIEPSPQRCQPFCPYFGICGGCALQHTTVFNQLNIKQEILEETLSRAKLHPAQKTGPPLASPQSTGYRYTTRLHLSGNGTLGFHRIQSHQLVAISHCPMLSPAINNVLERLSGSDIVSRLDPFCRQMELHCSPQDDAVSITLHLAASEQPPRNLLETLLKETEAQGITCKHRRQTSFFPQPVLLRQSFAMERFSYTLQWDNRCFFQINPVQNAHLVQLACSMAGKIAGRQILDLFCGIGNFSLPLALAGGMVTGIEHNKFSIRAARENAEDVGAVHCRFLAASVESQLQKLVKKKHHVDLILLDPPRKGLGKSTHQLAGMEAQKIIYISCDPATLSRDLQTLVQKNYTLLSVTPVDMFPHTHHIESLAVLEKN